MNKFFHFFLKKTKQLVVPPCVTAKDAGMVYQKKAKEQLTILLNSSCDTIY